MTIAVLRRTVAARIASLQAQRDREMSIPAGASPLERASAFDAYWADANSDAYAVDDHTEGQIEALEWVLQRLDAVQP